MFDVYLDYWRQMPFLRPWTEHVERYLQADVEVHADGTVTCRTSRAAVEDDFGEIARMPVGEWNALLQRVEAPARVLWATEGLLEPGQPVLPKEAAEALAAYLPIARLVPVGRANHYTIVFSPDGPNPLELPLS